MSIPGKVLIALLCALASAAAFSTLNPEYSLIGALIPSAIAAVAAVILSHRALPVPGALADGEPADRTAAPQPPAAAGKSERNGDRGRERQRASGNTRRREPKPDTPPPAKTETRGPVASAGDLEEGTVKWFNVTKGYGFIIRGNGEEIFVHHRSIQGDGRGRLEDGSAVRFRVASTDKGPQAEDVEAL